MKQFFSAALIAGAIFVVSAAASYGQQTQSPEPTPSATRKPAPKPIPAPVAAAPAAVAGDAVLVGAGDIVDCADLTGAEATAKLLDKIPGTVFTAGDTVYPDGTP